MPAPESLSIQVVTGPGQLRDFLALKNQIYQSDPVFVRPLDSMERLQLDVDRHPFYQHASRELFLCYRNGQPVGRIAAIKDDLHNEFHNDSTGFFGFFETIDDPQVVELLLKTAAQWLRDHGCDVMRGPVNPSMKGEFGVLVFGNQTSPMVMMGHTPTRYQKHLHEAGLKTVKRFFAYRFFSKDLDSVEQQWAHLKTMGAKIRKRYPKLELRAVNAANFESTMREVNELGNRVRSGGWGFVPLTEPELQFMIKNLRRVIRYDMIYVAFWEGKLVGYIVTIPDVNWAIRRARGPMDWIRMIQLPWLIRRTPRSRVIALGVDEAYRNKGVAMMLIQCLVDNYDAFAEWEFSWVLEDNIRSIRAIGRTLPLIQTKTYELYETPLQ